MTKRKRNRVGQDSQNGRTTWTTRTVLLVGGTGLAAVAVVGAIVAALWPEAPDEPRAREYRDVTACLLTADSGLTDPAAEPVWAGMQEASLQTRGRVQFLEVNGPQTVDNAAGYLGSLVGSQCQLILAVGEAPGAALLRDAPRHADATFVLIGDVDAAANADADADAGSGADAGPPDVAGNVTVIAEADPTAVQQRVRDLVTEAFGDTDAD
ncbi:hypothetical protein ACN27F_29810 [Solwaraspora sp. WMMB335]|uniref:hypothetical protein n=1 Tax=Solwaraspora sp. WMMB335 TaxID=3404118 RepID=UPI003B94AA59